MHHTIRALLCRYDFLIFCRLSLGAPVLLAVTELDSTDKTSNGKNGSASAVGKDFSLINTEACKSIEQLSENNNFAASQKYLDSGVLQQRCEARYKKALQERQSDAMKLGPVGTTVQTQLLFDKLAKT